MLPIVALVLGIGLILLVLWEAFNTILLPRRVIGRLPVTFSVYRGTWAMWRILAHPLPDGDDQESSSGRDNFLAFFGPLGLIMLVVVWAALLIIGFALVQWSFGPQSLT